MIGFQEAHYNPSNEGAEFQQARFGLAYHIWTEYEDDNIKFWHYVRSDRTGTWYYVEFTPYSKLTQDDLFELAGMIDQTEEYEISSANSCEFD